MKFTDIKDLTVEELRKRQKDMKDELFEMKMKHTLGQVANPLQIRFLRKDISRVNTALQAKLAH